MSKTKLVNIKRRMQFTRPNGETVTLEPGLQQVSSERYKGDDGKPNGPENAKSDAEHWMLQAPENAEFPNGDAKPDDDAPATLPDANGGIDAGKPAAPGSDSARGTAPGVTASTDQTDQSATDKGTKKA